MAVLGARRGRFLVLAALVLLSVLIAAAIAATQPSTRPVVTHRPWLATGEPLEQRVGQLLAALTLEEKARMLYGIAPPASSHAVGYVHGIARLGVPPLVLSDGPVGLRDTPRAKPVRPATALPATVSLAASFDPTLAYSYGQTLGSEARARGVDVLYGPAINIDRVPVGGRNFEYFSEDPYLTGQLAASYVRGVQSRRVAAQVKHFALNNQENSRHTASSNADQRTMREIYLPAWQTAVQSGHAWSVMCANNAVNGTYSCQNTALLRDLLEGEWAFDGVVGSDYAATHSAGASVTAGLDQSFTLRDWGAYYRDLPRLVRSGSISPGALDERVRRVLRMMFRIGLFDGTHGAAKVDTAADSGVARQAAEEGTVLLRNDAGLLPLSATARHSISVIGPYARTAYTGGGGSSHVLAYHAVSPVQGITARAGPSVTVTADDGGNIARAAAVAAAADVAIVVVGDRSKEGQDRASMALPGEQDALISAVAKANPDTVVVLNTGAPVTMPWLAQVHTLLEAWYPGQEDGNALAAILFGAVDTSGRLPVTFPVSAAQDPAMGGTRYPAGPHGYDYTEGLDVGYRGFDARGLTPLFPFGFGLSYTTFGYARLTVAPVSGDGVRVSYTVTNTGRRTGVAVPQVYLSFPKAAGEPPRQLVAFGRTTLSPGASRGFTLTVPRQSFQFWGGQGWQLADGSYGVSVGSSSRDLPLSAAVPSPSGR